MKKPFFLLAIASFGIFTLAGCGKTTENTNIAATKNEAPAKNILKPGDVSLDKAVKVIELVDSVAANKDAWKGKDVAVTGYVSATSSSGGNHQLLTLTNDQTATNKKEITCAFQGDKPDALFTKTVEVKGKISSVTDGEYKTVNLEPCELKK